MNINFEKILQSIITAGVLGLCAIAWGTYKEFITLVTKVDHIANKLEKSEIRDEKMTNKMNALENRIFLIEHKAG